MLVMSPKGWRSTLSVASMEVLHHVPWPSAHFTTYLRRYRRRIRKTYMLVSLFDYRYKRMLRSKSLRDKNTFCCF